MTHEIIEWLVIIGIASLIASPYIISYVLTAYIAQKERDNIEYTNIVLEDVYKSINASDLDNESKEICNEILMRKFNILQARYNFLNK